MHTVGFRYWICPGLMQPHLRAQSLPFRALLVCRASSVIVPDTLAAPHRHRLTSLAFSNAQLDKNWSDRRWHPTLRAPSIRNDARGKFGGFHAFMCLNALLCSVVIGYRCRQRYQDAIRAKIDEASPYRKTELGEDSLEFIMNYSTAIALKIFDANNFRLVDFDDYASTVVYFCALNCEGMVEVPVEVFFEWNPGYQEYHYWLYEYHRDLLLSLPDCDLRDRLRGRMRDACLRLHALLSDSSVQGALEETVNWGLYGEEKVNPVKYDSRLCVSQLGERCFHTLAGIIDKAEEMVDYTVIEVWR
ncbi:uncharacterized protein EV420DRAFT_1562155 [Desarmillaria tabescens]|uniref:Uncharacterized protein n=1 Tax=Armillaria tabescens TaxID=1929756 RepID=A0AA39JZU8_ARMTA|nr:uncharacterized protein EV420DRAFT_1562155 [Desarmillaria tabescens]KAK0450519.1 hypothetical protein EV420DRAFT_1562155 [Desarmillaria tabescens]